MSDNVAGTRADVPGAVSVESPTAMTPASRSSTRIADRSRAASIRGSVHSTHAALSATAPVTPAASQGRQFQ